MVDREGRDTALRTRVLIVGYGPCGATVANHLGLYGIEAIVIDRAAEVLDYPRAVGMDDEALRSFQAVGLADRLLADMVQNAQARYFTSSGRCFAHVHPAGQPFGWPRRNMFIQPLAEETLREGVTRYPGVCVLLGHELQSLEQGDDRVSAVVATPDGTAIRIDADYVVGTDGGRSTVRGLIGVTLEGKTDAARWLVVDLRDDPIYAPYSGVYTHVDRPHMSIDLPYDYRRFEFRIPPDDRDEDVVQPERLERLLRPFYKEGAILDRIVRARVYVHHSRIADRFRVGRVFLAGDAAHLQPPFFGQGMNSGLRDATNLAWKIAAVLTGRAAPALLETYETERHDHARAMVQIASTFGRLYAPGNRIAEFLRDTLFRVVQTFPSARDYIMQMRFKPMPRYTDGLVLHRHPIAKSSPVGRMFMQPLVETADRKRMKLDDAIGPWFAVIGINADPAAFLAAEERAYWSGIGARLVHVRQARRKPLPAEQVTGSLVLDDLMGGFRDWLQQNPGVRFIFLRPDRYVAAIASEDDVSTVSAGLRRLIGAPTSLTQSESAAA
jgi:3-(3-hydroxy-phenyl)propionate hydroxylase